MSLAESGAGSLAGPGAKSLAESGDEITESVADRTEMRAES